MTKIFKTLNFLCVFLGIMILGSCSELRYVKKAKEYDHQLNEDWYNVGIVIMDGVYNTELTAPMDIFQHTRYRKGIRAMNVFTIAKEMRPVTTFEGLLIYPDYDYNRVHPKIDILVVPSAEGHLDKDLKDEMLLSFIKKAGSTAEYITSHCDGSFVLAQAGLLEGKKCTTYPGDRAAMQEMFPRCNVLNDVLFVHDEKCITSVGGARSFDAALYLCEVLYGSTIAKEIAKGLVIDWDLSSIPHWKE